MTLPRSRTALLTSASVSPPPIIPRHMAPLSMQAGSALKSSAWSQAIHVLRFFWVLLALAPLMMFSSALRAQELVEVVPQIWQMLDYLASDYAGAVEDGKIISETEYAEMQEFSATVRARLVELPPRAGQAALLAQAQELIRLVDQKAESADVAARV